VEKRKWGSRILQKLLCNIYERKGGISRPMKKRLGGAKQFLDGNQGRNPSRLWNFKLCDHYTQKKRGKGGTLGGS